MSVNFMVHCDRMSRQGCQNVRQSSIFCGHFPVCHTTDIVGDWLVSNWSLGRCQVLHHTRLQQTMDDQSMASGSRSDVLLIVRINGWTHHVQFVQQVQSQYIPVSGRFRI